MNRINVLDHGFVILRNLAGPTRRQYDEDINHSPHASPSSGVGNNFRAFDADDIDPANAARMSFDQMDSGRTREEDLKLCKYLMKNWHNSPFEMVVAWIEMKLPIFVARQFVRHRTVSINEMSGRYVTLPAEWYIPRIEDVVFQVKDKKQGGRPINMDDSVDVAIGETYRRELNESCRLSYYDRYLSFLDIGIANEQARLELHLNHYTHWLWKQDLHNILHFLRLRDHSHAQKEAQYYAQAIDSLLRAQLPHCMALYDEYRKLDS